MTKDTRTFQTSKKLLFSLDSASEKDSSANSHYGRDRRTGI